MSEYNYNLQQAPESSMQTIESYKRYELKDDLNFLGNVLDTSERTLKKQLDLTKKQNDAILEQLFDDKVTEAINEHTRTPGASRSQLDNDINQLLWDPQFRTLTMATKNAILNQRNYQRPIIPSVEAEKITSEAEAKKTAEEQQRYIDLTNAYEPRELFDNMTTEAKIAKGRQLAAQQQFNLEVIPPFLTSDMSETDKKQGLMITANSLSKAIGNTILEQLKTGDITPEWMNAQKLEMFKQLVARGYPEEFAQYAIDTATRPYDGLLGQIKQSREDAVKYAQQRKGYLEDLINAREMEVLGTTPSRMDDYVRNFQYFDPEIQVKIQPLMEKQFTTAEQIRNLPGFSTPQAVFDNFQYFFGSPTATSNQKMNATTAGNSSLGDMYDEAVKNGENKSKDYQDTMSYNIRTLVENIADNAPAFAEAYKKYSSPESKAEYQRQFGRMLEAAFNNDLAKLGREAMGAVSYKNGEFFSSNSLDKNRIAELNGLLGNLRAINRTLGGDVFDEKKLTALIKKGLTDNALHISNTPKRGFVQGMLEDFSTTIMSPIVGIGRLVGDEDYEPMAVTPRQAVQNDYNRKQTQDNAVEALRKARTESVLGPGSYPAPKEEGISFWKWVVKASTVIPRGLYNAPQWIEKKNPVQLAKQAGATVVQATRDLKDWLKSSEDTKERIKKEEGFNSYTTDGTIGYGFNLSEIRKYPDEIKIRLEEVAPGITSEEFERAHMMNPTKRPNILGVNTANDIFDVLYEVASADAINFAGKSWSNLSDARKQALLDMSYNLGGTRLRAFKKLKQALQEGNYDKASEEILDSNYAKQLPNRARRNSVLMKNGKF